MVVPRLLDAALQLRVHSPRPVLQVQAMGSAVYLRHVRALALRLCRLGEQVMVEVVYQSLPSSAVALLIYLELVQQVQEEVQVQHRLETVKVRA